MCSGSGSRRLLYWHIFVNWYNRLNRTAGRWRQSPDPAQVNTAIRNSHPTFTREQDGYFLFFRFRIATIRRPVVSIIMNSSYVLIRFPPSARLGTSGAALSAALVSLLYCQGATNQFLVIPGQVNSLVELVSFCLSKPIDFFICIEETFFVTEAQSILLFPVKVLRHNIL